MMRQSDRKPHVRDTVFMTGWLFADLLLALAILFLAANTIGIKIPPPPPPKLVVTPTSLNPTSSNCTGGISRPQCTVTLTETADSLGIVDWTASSDISTGLVFSPASGSLTPGKSVNLQISHIPCENDSFSFSGSRGATPVRILWHCTPRQERLDFKYQKISLQNVDYNGLLNDSSKAVNDIKQRLKSNPILQGRSVGLAIVYGGALNNGEISQAQQIAAKVYAILKSLGQEGYFFQRASYYVSLYSLYTDPSSVEIDVYLFL